MEPHAPCRGTISGFRGPFTVGVSVFGISLPTLVLASLSVAAVTTLYS